MDWPWALLLIGGTLLLLMATGFPVAFAMLMTTALGAFLWWGGQGGLEQLVNNLAESLTTFVLLPIPLFALMGELLFHSGIATKMIDAIDHWMGRLPGRLSLLAVATGGLLSTLTGVGSATIAILGSELVPEMQERGYKTSMSLGPILGSSGLAIMIPPSGLAVLLAAIGQISVGKLLLAIIVPGLLMAALYAAYIIVRCILQPSLAPRHTPEPMPITRLVADTVRHVLPVGIVFFLVTGVIFLGIATPSEAAASGVVGVIVLIAYYRRLNWKIIKQSLTGTARITVMIFFILASARGFGQILAFAGITQGLVKIVIGLPLSPIVLTGCMLFLMIVLGMFLPVIAIMTVCLPLLLPIITTLGFSQLWFAAMMLLTMEMAVVSPPYGVDLFVMQSVAPAGTTLGDIYKASLPFLACDIIALGFILLFPSIALWLPGSAG